jgi:hypothetical protein
MLFQYTENLSPNGTASQSSYYYWQYRNLNLTADLAITGGRAHDVLSGSCAVTQYSPTRYWAWWMLTFPVDTVYITNVKIYFRSDGKFKVHSIFPCEIYLTMQTNLKRLRQVEHIRGHLSIQFLYHHWLAYFNKKINWK